MPDTRATRHARQVETWNGATGAQWAANETRTERGLDLTLNALFAWGDPTKGARIVDVGCGAGGTALALARAVGPARDSLRPTPQIASLFPNAASSEKRTKQR